MCQTQVGLDHHGIKILQCRISLKPFGLCKKFRHLLIREASPEHIIRVLQRKQEVKAAIDLLRGEKEINIGPLREEITQGLQKTEIQVQSALSRANEFVTSLLQRINEEVRADVDRSRQELGATLRMIKEEGANNVSGLRREMSADSSRVDSLREEVRKIADEIIAVMQPDRDTCFKVCSEYILSDLRKH
jgi:predicted transcriptional regulator